MPENITQPSVANQIETMTLQWQRAFNTKQYQHAVNLAQHMIDLQPNYATHYLNLADAYYHLSQLDKALQVCHAAIYHTDVKQSATLRLSDCLNRLEQYQNVVALLEPCLQDKRFSRLPQHEQAKFYQQATIAYLQLESFGLAVDCARKAVKHMGADVKYQENLLLALYRFALHCKMLNETEELKWIHQEIQPMFEHIYSTECPVGQIIRVMYSIKLWQWLEEIDFNYKKEIALLTQIVASTQQLARQGKIASDIALAFSTTVYLVKARLNCAVHKWEDDDTNDSETVEFKLFCYQQSTQFYHSVHQALQHADSNFILARMRQILGEPNLSIETIYLEQLKFLAKSKFHVIGAKIATEARQLFPLNIYIYDYLFEFTLHLWKANQTQPDFSFNNWAISRLIMDSSAALAEQKLEFAGQIIDCVLVYVDLRREERLRLFQELTFLFHKYHYFIFAWKYLLLTLQEIGSNPQNLSATLLAVIMQSVHHTIPNGQTLLHFAINSIQLPMPDWLINHLLGLLIQAGTHLKAQDNSHKTPMDIALQRAAQINVDINLANDVKQQMLANLLFMISYLNNKVCNVADLTEYNFSHISQNKLYLTSSVDNEQQSIDKYILYRMLGQCKANDGQSLHFKQILTDACRFEVSANDQNFHALIKRQLQHLEQNLTETSTTANHFFKKDSSKRPRNEQNLETASKKSRQFSPNSS
jgi:tetratricopeptide (TPR) repeat protein